ncbi:MAG: hypothetical protein IPO81_08190 [Kouleothrix sp.]|nr:hypothetical protein [Kouleothrix sp.]
MTHPERRSAGIEPPWTWCARCQRAYLTGSSRVVRFTSEARHPQPAALSLCPYFDCGVSTTRHGWRWATIRLEHPEFPATPERDIIYAR